MRFSRVPVLMQRLFALLIIATFCLPPSAFAQQQQAPHPLPAPRYIPSHDFHTQNIKLNLHFDFTKEWAIGTATITFNPLVKDLNKIELDAGDMTINSVKFASGTALKFNADMKEEKLTVSLDRTYQPSDTLTIIVDYHTNGPVPNRSVNGGGGLTFIKPTQDDPTAPRQIWSQGESEYNHYWFPCYDHPNDFTTTEVVATVDKPLTVISNGKLISTKDNGDNTRTFDWKIDVPHATYLTSIVVGEYAQIEQNYAGIPVITNVYPNQVAEGRITAARMADMVRFFSEKTGVKYPYDKYAQTMTHDFNGGMENISATTMYDIMIHDARSDIDQTADSLESHELAHQWFGDFVTCRSWSDIWLNESFATYFQAMWDEHSVGRDDFLYLDVKSNQDQYFNAWRQGLRRPIVTKNYADPDAVFDTYAYPRGGAVLHMLRKTLGEDNWWRAINHYLTKYAHTPVDTEQFRIAIEEATGQSMDWFFDEWLYKMGHPIFRVTQNYDAGSKTLTLNVKQEQKPDPTWLYPQVTFFQMPVDVEVGTASGTHVERGWIDAKEDQNLTFKVDAEPTLVNFDYGDTMIKELTFDKPTDQLIYQLAHDEDSMGRIFALDNLSKRMRDSKTDTGEKSTITKAISTAVTADKFWGMRVDAAGALSGSSDSNAKTALIAATKDQNPRVRAKAINSLEATKDPALASLYLSFLNDQSYNVVRAAARALGETKSDKAYDALNKLLDQPSWRDSVRISGLIGLGALGDPRALDVAVRYAARGNPIQTRTAAVQILGAAGKNDPRAYQLIADAFDQGFDTNNFQLVVTAATALVSLGDPRGVDLFKARMNKLADSPQIQRFLGQFQKRLEDQIKSNSPKP
ncbi:MAG TPA: M1 family aminopeptidase [Blastocatellia bacterium]|nr:M1 family aminopeptidase [Blastocatellia bacterium]